MPSIKQNANLEYNPNSIVHANRKIAETAISNMSKAPDKLDRSGEDKSPKDLKNTAEEFNVDLNDVDAFLKQIDALFQKYLDQKESEIDWDITPKKRDYYNKIKRGGNLYKNRPFNKFTEYRPEFDKSEAIANVNNNFYLNN